MEKQITIPLVIPYDLENFIINDIPQTYPDLPQRDTNGPLLIPVHKTASHTPAAILPPLVETASEDGSLRYWVISNENMWACQRYAMDEVFEVFWALFHCFSASQFSLSHPDVVWSMARMFRRRILLPESSSSSTSSESSMFSNNGLTDRESRLFRAWVFAVPCLSHRSFKPSHTGSAGERKEDKYGHLLAIPDEMFWKDGDEGNWNGLDIPQWIDVSD